MIFPSRFFFFSFSRVFFYFYFVLFLYSFSAFSEQPTWIKANFHAHTRSDFIHDDGKDSPLALHQELAKRGVQFSVHSVHSVFNPKKEAGSFFQKQQQREQNSVPAITVSVGEELTVQKGPHFQGTSTFLHYTLPGNLNHLTLLGIHKWVPNETTVATACKEAHKQGGVCLVNHPGLGVNPGPMMWEPGLWEAPENRSLLDGLEVYNGVGYASSGIHFEKRYLEATAYSKLGIKLAATGSSDTHGTQHLEMVKRRFTKAGALATLLGLHPPPQRLKGPELDALTLVKTTIPSEKKVIEAIQNRKTIAAYNPGEIQINFPEIGEIKKTNQVELHLTISEKPKQILLYKEGVLLKTWSHQAQIFFQEKILQKAAYVFSIELQSGGRLMTSAVWYEPSL